MAKRKHASRSSVALANVRKFFPKVKTVTDADDDVFVEVTHTDVKNSAKKDHNGCAIAVASKRQFKATGMVVSPTMAYVVKNDRATRFQLPPSAQKEIVSFDRGAGFAEGNYELHRPSKSNRLGARRGRMLSPSKTHKGKGIRRFTHETTGIRAILGGKKRN